MAKDNVSIANLALSRIGISAKIASFDERSKEAIEINAVFDEVRERVLSAAPWPFARKVATLQKTGSTPYRFAYRYAYPADCLKIRKLLPEYPAGQSPEGFRTWLRTTPIRYELETDSTGQLTICTDEDIASVEYTLRITDPTRYDAKFTGAFAWALATEISLPLAKTLDFSKNAAAAYEKEIAEAISLAMNEEKVDDNPDSEFVRARY